VTAVLAVMAVAPLISLVVSLWRETSGGLR
jgi:hypothetical protein